MEIIIFGISHFDPQSYKNLVKILRCQKSSRSDPPLFIATEWGQKAFEEIRNQRPQFREMIKNNWPQLSTNQQALDVIVKTLGFEGDCYTELFPSTKTIWLDNDRDVSVSDYAVNRLSMYKGFLNNKVPGDIIQDLHLEAARRIQTAQLDDTSRDKKWAENLAQQFVSSSNGYGFAIVGRLHATNAIANNFFSALSERGFTCSWHDLST